MSLVGDYEPGPAPSPRGGFATCEGKKDAGTRLK